MSLVGQTIGNYKVVQQIGEGGMGVVYLAEHPIIGRTVAIKLLHNSFAKDSETVARFFNEARAIHLIAHPNIVEILDFGQTNDGQPYFIMEYLLGESLAERIARGPVPPAEAVSIVSQICDALQAAHDKKIVHRDLKPHNVHLVDHDGRQVVKILDFGVAKMSTGWDTAQSGGHSVKTRTGSLMGTPLYMSPEQCRGSGKLDHRTDIYSLAVILFEMICKRPPFLAEGVGELFAKHMLEPAPSLAEFAPKTPPHIVRAVARSLSKDLDDRFPDMRSFRQALNSEDGAAERARSTGRPGPGDGPAARSRQSVSTAAGVPDQTTLSSMVSELDDIPALGGRNRMAWIVAGAMVVVLVAAVGLVAARKSRSSHVAAVSPTSSPGEMSSINPSRAGSGASAAPSPAAPRAANATDLVSITFQAEPPGTHLLRKLEGSKETEDLGTVPVEVRLPRGSESSEYLLRADNHKERTVTIEPSHDQVVRLTLDAEKPKPAAARPARPRRPLIHDTDGLAVPSF